MRITDYTSLREAIISHGKRTDVLSQVDGFIQSTEVELWERLTSTKMDTLTEFTTGTADRFEPLPTGYISPRRMEIILDTDLRVPVEYKDPQNLQQNTNYWYNVYSGRPYQFTISDDQIEFNTVPDQAYDVEFLHYAELNDITASTPTNALLTAYPTTYLFGCLKYYWIWAENDAKAAKYDGLFDEMIGKANKKERRKRYGPSPAVSTPGMVI